MWCVKLTFMCCFHMSKDAVCTIKYVFDDIKRSFVFRKLLEKHFSTLQKKQINLKKDVETFHSITFAGAVFYF